ncbi:glycoside hydrolase family 71/99-like protein [Croceivirga thetidis]|uniref:Glycosyl hydrolase family 99 n=1 Tax=Croceivirga thetidis TaxID=2721623 RepID=A0ABX1GQF6_9FLAO|nr:glycoside hydrolase family 71/99-like protein [Croceivirga thetidis]NKI32158.1 hypothetical protein [Croceivirga thetidis]
MKQLNLHFILAISLLITIIASCTKDDQNELLVEESLNNVVQDSIVSDSTLLQILIEEDDIIEQIKSGKIVDISGMEVPKDNPKKVYAHYMPWFQSKDYDGWWGHHWTMANKNPENIDENGKREIASFFYPEIGPYSSIDPDLQEYHFLMMKMAGIDGVIFDWYGSRDYYDYGIMKLATETFMWRLEDLGLDFSIMYEDRTAVQAVDLGYAPDAVTAAKQDFEYVRDTYMTSPNYIQWEEKPLLLVFGPHHIQNTSDWDEIFTVFPEQEKPHYATLWGASEPWVGDSATGEFAWIDRTHLEAHGHYYWHMNQPQNEDRLRIGSVYPSFMNYSELGGWGLQHDWQIEPDGGNIFVETLNYTHHQTADFIQLATWNDFGEGTPIEPTEEFGFMYLQLLQEYTGVDFTPEDLQTAQDLYFLRKEFSNDGNDAKSSSATERKKKNKVQQYLDRAYQHIKKGNMKRARFILWAIERFYKN